MERLYKFFFLLFLAFLAVSFVYGTLLSWITIKAIQAQFGIAIALDPVPFKTILKAGFLQGLVYSLVLLLFVIFLLKRSMNYGQRFTIKQIIAVAGWFLLVTTLLYIISCIFFPDEWQLLVIACIAWLSLFLTLHAKIQKTE